MIQMFILLHYDFQPHVDSSKKLETFYILNLITTSI